MCTLLRKRPMGRTTEDTNSRGNGTALHVLRVRVRVRVREMKSRGKGNTHAHGCGRREAGRCTRDPVGLGFSLGLGTHHAYDWPMRRGSHGLPSRSSAQSSFTTRITSSSRLAVLDS